MLNLEKISDFHYKSSYGYFIFKEGSWSFIPFEKEYSKNQLIEIIEVLEDLPTS
jgi:hypothetical protein